MPATPRPQPSLSDETAASLRSQIFSGQLPAGSLLAEAATARRLGVSRVPVREALFTLEQEGLVQVSPTGRAYVRPLLPHDFEELLLLRLTLEPLAARLATPALRQNTQPLEANLHATAKAQTLAELTHLDLEFHALLLHASGQPRLEKLWRSIRSELELWLSQLQRTHAHRTLQTREETLLAHRKLLDAFRTQSPETCEQLLRDHVLSWRQWLPLAEPNPSPTTPPTSRRPNRTPKTQTNPKTTTQP